MLNAYIGRSFWWAVISKTSSRLPAATLLPTSVGSGPEQPADLPYSSLPPAPLARPMEPIAALKAMASDREQSSPAHVAPAAPAEAPVPPPPAPHPVKRTIQKKKHACDHPGCGKAFGTSPHLASHKRTHTGERPYGCKDCAARFAHKTTLVSHERVHTKERPYECKVCGASFAQKGNLTIHERTHTKQKPYVCEVCGAGFAQKGTLDIHTRTHTGYKPFVCDVCGARFAQGSHLITHKRVHTGERPYDCTDCGARFSQLSQVNVHKRTHTGQRPHVCKDCGVGFADSGNLAKHKRAIHTARGQQRQKKKEECVARFLTESGITFEREVVVNFCGEAERRHARVDFTIYREWALTSWNATRSNTVTTPLAATPGACSTSSRRF